MPGGISTTYEHGGHDSLGIADCGLRIANWGQGAEERRGGGGTPRAPADEAPAPLQTLTGKMPVPLGRGGSGTGVEPVPTGERDTDGASAPLGQAGVPVSLGLGWWVRVQ